MADAARLRIKIGDGLSDEDRAAPAQALVRDLSGLDAVREVKPGTEEAPEGARPIERILTTRSLGPAPEKNDQLRKRHRSKRTKAPQASAPKCVQGGSY